MAYSGRPAEGGAISNGVKTSRLKLIVGLGNPGEPYRFTRHNAGARAVERFAQGKGFRFHPSRSFRSLVAEGRLGASHGIFLLPQTFMNLSGEAVGAVVKKKEIITEDILVVCDDVALPLGALRARPQGSDGGHNGLASVLAHLKTKHIARLRLGIAGDSIRGDLADYVLAPFLKQESAAVEAMLERAASAIGTWSEAGTARCMNLFNTTRKRSV